MAEEVGVRLAELLGGLSLACDVVSGFPHGKVLRTTVLAASIARAQGGSDEVVRDAMYVTLLRYLGCTGFAHEEGAIYGAGEDIVLRNVMAFADAADPVGTVSAIVRRIGSGARLRERVPAVARLLGGDAPSVHARAQCDTSVKIAEMIGASARIRDALRQICERWDGRGEPQRLEGEAIALAIRIHHVADVVEIAHHRGGREFARAILAKRSGGNFDPRLADAVRAHEGEMLAAIEEPRILDRFLAIEPEPHARVADERVEDVLRAVACFVDLKSAWFLGHSIGVAELAGRAADELGIDRAGRRDLVRAALLHDIGRLTVPNAIWDRPGPLDDGARERVRLHAYYTERVLAQSPPVRALAGLASAGHERIDASGYHRSLAGPQLVRGARVLAAADAAHAMGEARPHRAALGQDAIVRELVGEVRAGRLDREAVDAVLASIGARPAARRAPGVSDRELEVLRLVARGKTNREIGIILGISARTVQNHVAHAYDKIGVSSRAGAAMWVMERGLATPE